MAMYRAKFLWATIWKSMSIHGLSVTTLVLDSWGSRGLSLSSSGDTLDSSDDSSDDDSSESPGDSYQEEGTEDMEVATTV